MVRFTVSLAVTQDYDGAFAYEEFINDLRTRLQVGQPIRNVPVLAVDGNIDFFDVDLTYTDDDSNTTHTVHVRLRTDNLYLIGYRPGNSDTWFELANEGVGTILINEPRMTTRVLPFGENYRDLARYADVPSRLQTLRLSASQIAQAITTLAANTASDRDKARAILTLIIALAEAPRFRYVSDFVSRSWLSEQELGENLAALLRAWSDLSSAVQRAQNPGQVFVFLNSTGLIGNNNFDGAIDALGIMHLECPSEPGPSGSRSRRSVPGTVYVKGQPLLEIYYVLLNDVTGGESSQLKLYGTITVTDSAGTIDVWNRDKSKPLETKPSAYIPLKGPGRPLHAADTLYIDLDLQNSSTTHSIAKGTIAFNPFDYYSLTKKDDATPRRVSGDNGSVTVSYMVMSDGLYAQIAVVIIKGDGGKTQVYGDIVANNGHGQSTLFLTQRDDAFDVETRASIPLLRNIVAVPTKDTLTVNVNIQDWNWILSDTQIAWGSAVFQPLYMRSENKRIKGAGGEIEVQVTWL
ncbi:hypothetical protein D9757_006834 [Collybiopsis confluens]|uniref:rRNA N-glycosylase n=1 Tax=Collybiopsis confluens TaxID=2823264 RepID=A0A8H5MAY0_9AGAR|nr:hypothetical protein D9757_006834 [Collybiopsis confluens]